MASYVPGEWELVRETLGAVAFIGRGRVDAAASARFKERIVAGAELTRDGVVAFRGVDAQRILKEELAIERSLASTYRLLHRLQLSWLAPLAEYPNVAVKATGQPGYAEDAYPCRSFHEHLHRCFDAFGADRMFWGTDITRMPCSWRQCVRVFTEELPWLQGRDLELVMGEALCNWVGWRLAA